MIKRNILVVVIVALLATLAILLVRAPNFQEPASLNPAVIFQTGGGVLVEVEVADDAAERQVGLMNREFLGPNKGMLFIFEQQQQLNFWMKNTLIPLDIIFINNELEVVNIQEAVPCEADPCRFYTSTKPARYVVEVNQGFSKEKGISPGTMVKIPDI